MTTHVRYSRCKGTECPVVPQSICQYLNVITSNLKNRRTSECMEQPVITMIPLDLAINLGTRSSSTAISCTCCLWLWAEVYWFSMVTLSKWLPANHIGFFFFWFTGSKFHSALNIKFKLQWHITCICICILVIWNNVQLQSTHCLQLPTPAVQGYPSRSLIYNFSLLTSTLYPGSTPGLGLIWQHMSDTAGAKGQNAQWSHKVYVSI